MLKSVLYEYQYLPEPVKLLVKSIQNHLEDCNSITYTVYDKDSVNTKYPINRPRVWLISQEGKVLGTCKTYTVSFDYIKTPMLCFPSKQSVATVTKEKGKFLYCLATDVSEPILQTFYSEFTEVQDVEAELHSAYMKTELNKFQMETAEDFGFEEID